MHPTTSLERELSKKQHIVIGVDEVGCGSLAGPVVACALHLPLTVKIPGIRDSKMLSSQKRMEIATEFIRHGISWTIGVASVYEIEIFNIRQASFLAMRRACEAFPNATFALVDGWKIPYLQLPQRAMIRGDQRVLCIAAASIIAKVVRDRLMRMWDQDYPQYFFAKHKGYGTDLHREALRKWGLSPLHRSNFVKNFLAAS